MGGYVKRVIEMLPKLSEEEVRRLFKSVASENSLLDSIIESLPTGLVIVDKKWKIESADELSDALFAFMRGTITSDKLWSIIDNAVAEKRKSNSTKPSTGGGAGGGGGGSWTSGKSPNSSNPVLTNLIPFGHGLNAKIPYSKRK